MAEQKETKSNAKFPKTKLVESKKYANRKDILNVLLEDDKEYTFAEVDKRVNEYMKGKVK